MTDYPDWWVALTDVPQLAGLLRGGLLRKVRLLDIVCPDDGGRYMQIIDIGGRPLGILTNSTDKLSVQGNDAGGIGTTRRSHGHREATQGLWLDNARLFAPHLRPQVQCRHRQTRIPVAWIHQHLEAGTRRVVWPEPSHSASV